MQYLVDTPLSEFRAWSGGKDRLEEAIANGTVDKVEEFIDMLSEDREEPLSDTEINDLLWFDEEVHAIIGSGDPVQYIRDNFSCKLSDEALEFLVDNKKDEVESLNEFDKILECAQEFETKEEAITALNCEDEEEFDSQYDYELLENGNVLVYDM